MLTKDLYADADMPSEEPRVESLKASGLWLEGQLRLAQAKLLQASILFKRAYRHERFLAQQSSTALERTEHLLNAFRAALDARDPGAAAIVDSDIEASQVWTTLPSEQRGDLQQSLSDLRTVLDAQQLELRSLWTVVRAKVPGNRWDDLPETLLKDALDRFPGFAAFHWVAFRRAEAEQDFISADRALAVGYELEPHDPRYTAMRIVMASKSLSGAQLRVKSEELYAKTPESSLAAYMSALALLASSPRASKQHRDVLKDVIKRARAALELRPAELTENMKRTATLLVDYCQWKLGDPAARSPRLLEMEALSQALPSPTDPRFERELVASAPQPQV